jgi:hypothetical protein
MPITRAAPIEYAEHFETYTRLVNGDDLVKAMYAGCKGLNDFVLNIPSAKLDYRYAEGKWSIKEVIVHLIDCERVFAYRALSIARKDSTHLPGFDENVWALAMNASGRNIASILEEYNAVRMATIALFNSFNNGEDLHRGIVNKNESSVRAWGYIICGHEIHHMNVINERYLNH